MLLENERRWKFGERLGDDFTNNGRTRLSLSTPHLPRRKPIVDLPDCNAREKNDDTSEIEENQQYTTSKTCLPLGLSSPLVIPHLDVDCDQTGGT